jgi:predicted permease
VRERLLALLMKLYPREFRKSRAEEILGFIDEDRERSSRGAVRFWTRTLFDLFAAAARMRWRERRRPRRARTRGSRSSLDDLRQALRSVRATPLASAVIVLTLALGIGLDTAIFSVVDSVLLEPFPYEEPDGLFYLHARWTEDGVERARHSGRDLERISRETRAFAELAAVMSIRQNLTDVDVPYQVQVGWSSRNLFRLLGVSPILGSGFTEDSPPGTLLLSHGLWQDAFGARDDVVGRVVRLDGHPYTVAGVLPRSFALYLPRFPARVDVWKVPDDWWQNGDPWSGDGLNVAMFDILGRLDPAASPVQAREEMRTLAAARRAEDAESSRAGLEYDALPLKDAFVAPVRQQLLLLLGAVVLVLLVGCCNVMSLMLARARARENELSLRLALGASRSRVARLLFAEALLLGAVGGGGGVLIAREATRLLESFRPESLPRLEPISIHPPVLVFALLLTIGATLVFGLVPALTAARGSSAGALLSASRSTPNPRQMLLSRSLVVLQLSLSLILCIGAALLGTSLKSLAEVHPGFDSEDVLSFSISLPGTKYEWPEGTDRFLRELESGIESIPGVRSAGVVWPLPLSRRVWSNTYVAGGVQEGERAYAEYRLATESFFETMGIPLLEGRVFSPADDRHVAVVSRALAERAFPGESAVGRTLQATPWGGAHEAFEVIGVVGDVRYADLREPPQETIYFDSRGWSWSDWEVDYVVRATAPPESYVGAIRGELSRLDPGIPLARPRPMSAYVSDHLSQNRFALSLVGLFAVVAGGLAVVGLYGVVSYSVNQCRREIGIRMALGCGRAGILGWVYRRGAILVAAGIVLGILGSLALTRFVEALLFGVTPTDAATLAAVALGLGLVSSLACYLPARRATRLDPMSVLRAE